MGKGSSSFSDMRGCVCLYGQCIAQKRLLVSSCCLSMQITEPDERVVKMVEELAAGPLPSWEPPPAVLLLNKVTCPRCSAISLATDALTTGRVFEVWLTENQGLNFSTWGMYWQIDRLTKEQRPLLDELREKLCSVYPFTDTFCISAKHRTGVADLREYLLSRCACHHMHQQKNTLADRADLGRLFPAVGTQSD